jgi:hypothetical protein
MSQSSSTKPSQALPGSRHLPGARELAAHKGRAAQVALVPSGLAEVAVFEARTSRGREIAKPI